DEIYRHVHNLASLGLQEKLAYILVRLQGQIQYRAVMVSTFLKKILCMGYLTMNYPLPPSLRSLYILDIYRQAMKIYMPQVYAGRVILFTGKECAHHDQVNWQKLLVGDPEIHEIPGNHLDISKEPHIQVWAEWRFLESNR